MTSINNVSQCETLSTMQDTTTCSRSALGLHNHRLFTEVLEVLEEVTGFDLCIAGGAVRDAIHGKPIKDLDVEVLNFADIYHNDEVSDIAEIMANRLEVAGAECIEIFNEYEGASSNANLDFVIKIKAMGYDINIILRSSHPETVEGLVSLYDMNLNQVAFYKGELHIVNPIKGIIIEPNGTVISLDRLERMKSKYPEYDFSKMYDYLEPVSQCETPNPFNL